MNTEISRRGFLAGAGASVAAALAAGGAWAAEARRTNSQDAKWIGTRYPGAVAIFYVSQSQVDSRDWDNIKEFHGPHHPLLGYYRHENRDTLLKHLHWIRRAGVDVIVYDVFPFGKWRITDIEKDRVLRWLMEALENQQNESRKLKLVLYLERYQSNPSLDELRYGMKFLRQRLVDRPYYFRYHGKPLVLAYINGANPVVDRYQAENRDIVVGRVRAYDGKDDWSYINSLPQPANREWMPVSPGIDPFMENSYLDKMAGKPVDLGKWKKFDRQDGEFFRQQFRVARQVHPEIVFLSGWNDWQYGCQIEPAVEYRFKYVDLAAQFLGRAEETRPYRDEQ